MAQTTYSIPNDRSTTDAITAFSTGGQASATLLTTVINRLTIVGADNDSVKLPVAVPGMEIVVANAHATKSANVFPSTDGYINAGAKDAAFALAAGKTALFTCAVAAKWNAILTA